MEHPMNKAFACAVTLFALALPAVAAAESVVPPENSAATQYTEAIPTGGGQKDASKADGRKRSPAAVLGSKKAHELDAQGPQGHAAAEVAAATAPVVAPSPPPSEAAPASPHEAGEGGNRKSESQGAPGTAPAPGQQATTPTPSQLTASGGSSGLGEVLGQATGSSSDGGLGLFLPLLILSALVWALVYGLRRRRSAV